MFVANPDFPRTKEFLRKVSSVSTRAT